jgi:DNA polymerase-3 subunit delta
MAEAKNVSFGQIMKDLEARKFVPVYYLMGEESY